MLKSNVKVKFAVSFAACMIIVFVLLSLLPVNGEQEIYDNVVRLHVIANSDSDDDQRLKLLVRDRILETVSENGKYDSIDEAVVGLEAQKELIAREAEKVLIAQECFDKVRVELGYEDYPVRYYDNFVLPEGKYTSLRVIIGDGAGKNWWCVLYPPLCCASSAAEQEEDFLAAGFSSEQYKLILQDSKPKYKVRFKILEIIAEAFGFDY